ncbi:MAG: hypothetical protein KA214_10805 [Neisseriaceae bacterium]|nr:hypothetical protein [Neisseriaceae bacterium]
MLDTPFGSVYLTVNQQHQPYQADALPLSRGPFFVDGLYRLLVPIGPSTQQVCCGIAAKPELLLNSGPETGEDLACLGVNDGQYTVCHIGSLHEDNGEASGIVDGYQHHALTLTLPPHHLFDCVIFQIAWRTHTVPIGTEDVSTWLLCDPSIYGWHYQQGHLTL